MIALAPLHSSRVLGTPDVAQSLSGLIVRSDRRKAFTFSWKNRFEDYRVDRNVALPAPSRRWARPSFAATLRGMEVGDSLFIPRFIAWGARAYRVAPDDFTTRRVAEYGVHGTRIWRVAKTEPKPKETN